ncbi:hypothetical protein P691DRAFT_773734 [Macrolepiota fuliginosa MF-IS2]|uniref:Uncharacterized protein n=1 Tax=Macrolepiota fuliginosa MF-IS2 TaxID=1400762 RepID=A0A9P5XGQ9_9AGAR|nr:hypothetical protein P691DRAFT_773734 [Macrolepiota fuliginosa MF-IS2]
MGSTTLDEEVVVVFSAALLFGFYFATLLSCIRWLLFTDRGWEWRKVIDWPIVIVTFLIMGLNVVHASWDLHWTLRGAVEAANGPGPFSFSTPDLASIVACVLQNTNILLADMVLIHRCRVVYMRKKRVIMFPVFMWFVGLLCTILQIYLQAAHTKNPNIGPYSWASVNMTVGPGIVLLPFWISTVLLNAYASGALILRIHRVARECGFATPTRHLHFLIRLFAESGLLCFSINLAHFLVWFGSSTFAIQVIAAINPALIGIAFNWFIIRVATNRAEATRSAMPGNITSIKFAQSSIHHRTMADGPNGLISGGAIFELVIAATSGSNEDDHSTGEKSDSSGSTKVVARDSLCLAL